MKYKVGQKVRLIKMVNSTANLIPYVGKTGTVIEVNEGNDWPYRVRFSYGYSENTKEIELAPVGNCLNKKGDE